MSAADNQRLVEESASGLYGDGEAIWNAADRWNSYKRAQIDRFCRKESGSIRNVERILDAGCGNQPYDWLPPQTVSLDRFWKQASVHRYPVAASLQALPFRASVFDAVICVASVLNYVDAIASIAELSRVTKQGGRLLIHFETSTTFEQLGHSRWGSGAARVDTLNGGRPDSIWIYRPSFIFRAMEKVSLRIVRSRRFHILSALGLRLGLSQQAAAPLAHLDRLAQPLKTFSDDVILLAEKSLEASA